MVISRLPHVSVIGLLYLIMTHAAMAQDHSHHDHSGHDMTFDSTGMVMGSNKNNLPRDCKEISADYNFTVHAGTEFADAFPGTLFGFDEHEFAVKPCSRITVTFINNDEIRHQWMVHGLPKYLYAAGMFHLEAAGGQTQTGTFIVPSDNQTYLVHCDIAQHMEMGMKAQLKVGRGSGDLWSIPAISGDLNRDDYLPKKSLLWLVLATIAGVIVTTILFGINRR